MICKKAFLIAAMLPCLLGMMQTLQADIILNSGDTETVVVGTITTTSNALQHFGYHINNDNVTLDLHNNRGMMGGRNPDTFLNFYGQAVLTNGPGNRGLDFNNDTDFKNTGAVNRNNNYSNLWVGMFKPNATGNWKLRNAGDDDRAGIWFDLNQNGAFESTSAGLGTNRGEQLSWEDGGAKTVALTSGESYMVAFTHREGSGGSRADFRITSPSTAEQIIKPTRPSQNGFFSFDSVADTALGNVTVNGNSTLILPTTLLRAVGDSFTFANTQDDPSTLTINSIDRFQALDFTTATTLTGNGAILNLVNDPIVSLPAIAGSGDLTVNGAGTVSLAAANPAYTGMMTIGDGASLRLTGGGNFSIGEPLTLSGAGSASSGGALHSLANNHDINGAITLAGNTTIRKEGGGDMEFRGGGSGGIDTAGFELRIEAVNTIRIMDNGLSGNGTLLKEENGSLDIRTGNTGYTGTVNIRNGYVDLDNRTDPLGSGTVNVTDDGTLRLRNGVTVTNSNINISTDGEGTAGAIRSENNSNTITGQVNLAGDSRIHVNATQLTLGGVVTGSGAIDKQGTGTLVLANAGSDFTGQLDINAGTVRATSSTALNNTVGIDIGSGATLDVLGDGTLNVPVDIYNGLIGNSSAGTTLTLDGPITTPLIGDITFHGDGDTIVNSSFGNGGPVPTPNALWMRGFMNSGRQDPDLNFDPSGSSGGGLLVDTPVGGTAFTGNLDVNGDGTFRALIPAITRNDDYQSLFEGEFHALVDGDYTFTTTHKDDRTVIWLDKDQDGTFENSGFSTPGTSEQLTGLNNGTSTVTLTAGTYNIALGHKEHAGGSRIRALITTPTGAGPTSATVINPGDTTLPTAGGQAGLFSTTVRPENSVIKDGAGTTTLNAANTYSGETTIKGGTLIAANSDALGTIDGGTTVADGATLALQGGIAIPNETLTLGTNHGTGALVNISGDNSYAGNVTLGGSFATVDTQADSLTMTGSVDMASSNLTVTGNGNTVISGDISGTSLGGEIHTPGLLGAHQSGNPDLGPNSGNLGMVLGPLGGRSSAEHWKDIIGQNNSTLIYTGEIYLDGGGTTFLECIDDQTILTIDGVEMINDNTWNNAVHATLDRAAGWYDFEVRFANGGGGYGPQKQGGWTANFGFGMDVNGNDTQDEANFVFPLDPGDATLFRITSITSPSDLVKDGPGVLTLGGDNTYIGTSTVNAGTLLVNGTTSGQGNYTVATGATLGGSGTIGLAAGGNVTLADNAFLSPGDASADTLSIDGDLIVGSGVNFLWDLSPTGNDTIDVTGDLTLDDWTLTLTDLGGESHARHKLYLFTGFDQSGTSWADYDVTIDYSLVDSWMTFTDPSDLQVLWDAGGIYLTGLQTVPEPAGIVLLLLGMVGLATYARRRRK